MTESTNPKDLLARDTKLDISYWPTAATNMGVLKLMEGRFKYGPYNWRGKQVSFTTYIAACKRHLDDLLERVDYDEHGIHSIGGVLASAAIIADALAVGNLVDDRPLVTYNVHEMHTELAKKVKELREKFPKPVHVGVNDVVKPVVDSNRKMVIFT